MKPWLKYLLISLGVLIIILAVTLPLFLGRGAGMMSSGMPHFGSRMPMPMMMGRGGFGPMFGLVSAFRLLAWLALIALIAWAVVTLLRRSSAPLQPAPVVAVRACPSCGQTLQPGWVACPYCGVSFTSSAPPPPPDVAEGI